MGKLGFIVMKIIKLSIALFAIIAEIIFLVGLPIWITDKTNDQTYLFLYAVSIPVGFALIVATVSMVDWNNIIDFEYCYENIHYNDKD